jgi:hypothetical protein
MFQIVSQTVYRVLQRQLLGGYVNLLIRDKWKPFESRDFGDGEDSYCGLHDSNPEEQIGFYRLYGGGPLKHG